MAEYEGRAWPLLTSPHGAGGSGDAFYRNRTGGV